MKKILIILLSLIALLVLGWFGVYQFKAPAIQADIKQRVGEALVSNSLGWVKYTVDGRNVMLSGVAPSKVLAQHALDTANVYGLNSLSSNIKMGSSGVSTNQANSQSSDVSVQNVTAANIPALPVNMNIVKGESGEYTFNGTVPDVQLKQAIGAHLQAVGADPAKAVWQAELSSAKAPKHWQQNILNTISAAQLLQSAEANLTADEAVINGVAVSQDASDAAENFAQKISGDFTVKMDFAIVKPQQLNTQKVEDAPLVGSDSYAAKYCQAELNALLKKKKIIFTSGSTDLQTASTSLLDKISQVAGRCPNHKIQVHGYTDSQGAAAANKKLSKSRAKSVVAYLAQRGIERGRLVAIGHGEKNPIATNKTEAGRAKNRRIKLIVKGLKK